VEQAMDRTGEPKAFTPLAAHDAGGTYAQRDMSRAAKRSAFRQKPASADPAIGPDPEGSIPAKPPG
jgi:hypothetical protein